MCIYYVFYGCVTVEKAEIYVCGWNGNGQLGIGHFCNISVPVPIPGLQAITKVSCGWSHTMAMTSTCCVYHMTGNFDNDEFDKIHQLSTC